MGLDLASFASIRAFAADFLDRYDRLDVLCNNAGLVLQKRQETAEGFEATFGVNHLGHFLLTDLLLDRLRERAVRGSSTCRPHAHKQARNGLDFDDLQSTRRYRGFAVYSKSKLANISFTRELARRLDGSGVVVNVLHPGSSPAASGATATPGARRHRDGLRSARSRSTPNRACRLDLPRVLDDPTASPASTGTSARCARPSRAAHDDDAARRLWSASEALVASASS